MNIVQDPDSKPPFFENALGSLKNNLTAEQDIMAVEIFKCGGEALH